MEQCGPRVSGCIGNHIRGCANVECQRTRCSDEHERHRDGASHRCTSAAARGVIQQTWHAIHTHALGLSDKNSVPLLASGEVVTLVHLAGRRLANLYSTQASELDHKNPSKSAPNWRPL